MEKKLTIIVPIYNVYEYLERTLNTLLNQTSKDFDVLCVNDGSTDKSPEIIDEFVKKDARFKKLDKINGGLSDARNYGLKYVDTKYVMFLDGDDYFEPELVEACLKYMEKDNLDMFVYAFNKINLETNEIEESNMNIEDGVYNLRDNPELLAYTPNAAWNKCYKTSLFKDNGIEYPFGYRHQDLGTTPKLLYLAQRIGYLNKPLYNYIEDRPNNITTQVDNKLYHIIDISKEVVDYYKDMGIYDKYKQELSYLINRNFIQSLRKAVTLKDNQFVNKFIDDVFKFKKNSLSYPLKYEVIDAKTDYVYQHKNILKLYYKYKTLRGKR